MNSSKSDSRQRLCLCEISERGHALLTVAQIRVALSNFVSSLIGEHRLRVRPGGDLLLLVDHVALALIAAIAFDS